MTCLPILASQIKENNLESPFFSNLLICSQRLFSFGSKTNITCHLFHPFLNILNLNCSKRFSKIRVKLVKTSLHTELYLLFSGPPRTNINQMPQTRTNRINNFPNLLPKSEFLTVYMVIHSHFELSTGLANTAVYWELLPANNDATVITHVEIKHNIEINDNLHLSSVSFAYNNTQTTKNLKISTEKIYSSSTTTSMWVK